jgi:uncharacterized membrane protein (UPF0136 family)
MTLVSSPYSRDRCPRHGNGDGDQAGVDDPGSKGLLDSNQQLAYEWSRVQMGPTKIYFIVFGVLTIAGGIMGYVKAGSIASIIAGSITGVLLLIAAFLLPEYHAAGLATAFIVSLLLAAQFVPKFLRTGRVMPAGIMSILSVIGLIVALVAWIKE